MTSADESLPRSPSTSAVRAPPPPVDGKRTGVLRRGGAHKRGGAHGSGWRGDAPGGAGASAVGAGIADGEADGVDGGNRGNDGGDDGGNGVTAGADGGCMVVAGTPPPHSALTLQSAQSVQASHEPYSAPTPPSSQSPSLLYAHSFVHTVLGAASVGGGELVDRGDSSGGGGEGSAGGDGSGGPGGGGARGDGREGSGGLEAAPPHSALAGQSVQSVQIAHDVYSAPAPPSSQSPSL